MLLILIYCISERQWKTSTFPHWKLYCIPENAVKLTTFTLPLSFLLPLPPFLLVENSSTEHFCLSLFRSIYKLFQIPKSGL